MIVLVVAEQNGGVLHPMSLETVAAGRQWGAAAGADVHAAVIGGAGELLAGFDLAQVHSVEHELLRQYTPDGYSSAIQQLIAKLQPAMVLFPHTYQVRDFAPKLATAMRRVLVSDVVAMRFDQDAPVLVRQLFQGKVNADIRFTGEPPCFVSLQAGAWRADDLSPGSAPVQVFEPQLEASQIRTKPLERFRETTRAVDLSAAPIIVSSWPWN